MVLTSLFMYDLFFVFIEKLELLYLKNDIILLNKNKGGSM